MRVPFVIGVIILAAGCVCDCDVEAIVAARAGPSATDCGFVPLSEDLGPTLDCIDAAISEGRAVRAGWQRRGRDSEVRTYLAGHDGAFSLFGYDGGLNGGGGCARLTRTDCNAPPARATDPLGMEAYGCAGANAVAVCDR